MQLFDLFILDSGWKVLLIADIEIKYFLNNNIFRLIKHPLFVFF